MVIFQFAMLVYQRVIEEISGDDSFPPFAVSWKDDFLLGRVHSVDDKEGPKFGHLIWRHQGNQRNSPVKFVDFNALDCRYVKFA